jgi:hypothetical protein
MNWPPLRPTAGQVLSSAHRVLANLTSQAKAKQPLVFYPSIHPLPSGRCFWYLTFFILSGSSWTSVSVWWWWDQITAGQVPEDHLWNLAFLITTVCFRENRLARRCASIHITAEVRALTGVHAKKHWFLFLPSYRGTENSNVKDLKTYGAHQPISCRKLAASSACAGLHHQFTMRWKPCSDCWCLSWLTTADSAHMHKTNPFNKKYIHFSVKLIVPYLHMKIWNQA